jgi:predicted flap endonuclease-1-like 5' DNA nuclease
VKMSALGCCFWWFLLGALLGWLLNYWLGKCCRSKKKESSSPTPPPAPAAKTTQPPAATTPVNKVAAPTPAPAPAKPKATPVNKVAEKPAAKTAKKAPVKTTAKNVTIDLAAAKAAGIKIKSADDLTVIEGIGPKINELFKNNGLKTFADVSTAKVSEMRAILDKGGARFRIANPGTWAKQAKLAANNKWKELKKLQDDLSGGVKK